MKTILYTFLLMCSSILLTAQVHVTPPNGDVGIGTDAPTQKLDVNGNVNVRGQYFDIRRGLGGASFLRIGQDRTASGNAYLNLMSTTTYNDDYNLRLLSHQNGAAFIDHQGVQIFYIRNLQSASMIFRTANVNRMTIHKSGRVGIGTTNPHGSTKLDVKGAIGYNGTLLNTSDKRLKTNAKTFDYGLGEVLSLSPIYYDYNGKGGTEAGLTHVGIYAQDLKKTAPKLVSEFTYQEIIVEEDDDEKLEFTEKTSEPETYLNINESAIKYMLINAVKEQQTIIEDLQKEVAELRDIVENGNSRTGSSRQSIELQGKEASLKQNTPNPFSSRTLVEYYVPANTKKAAVRIYDSSGKLMHNESIRGTGEGNIQIEAGTIPAGTYNYSLIVDGKVIDTKQMVIVQ